MMTSRTGPIWDVHVSLAGRGDLSARIYRQLLDAILDGRLRPGERLPPTRERAGHGGLREAIARYVGVSRSVHASARDVIVTNGAQQALDLFGRVLVEPGACVAVEEPGYVAVRRLLVSLGARVVGVPVDAEGLVVSAIPRAARLVYVTPSHQFP